MNTWEEVEQQPEFGVLSSEDKASLHKDWHENVLNSLTEEDPEKVDAEGVNRFVATEKARNESLKTGQLFDDQAAQQAYAQQVQGRVGAQKQTMADLDELERAQFALKDAAANRGVTSGADRGMPVDPRVAEILDRDRQAAQKTLDEVSSRFTPEQLQQAKEAKATLNGERSTAVLGSDLYTDPALVLDKDKYRAAVAESNASPEAKARAMADFTTKRRQVAEQALRVLRVAGESPLPGAQDFPSWEASQPEDVRKLSPEDKALQYMRVMQGRGDIRKLTSAIGTGLLQGGTDIASQGLGVAAMVANSGKLAKKAAEVSEGASTLEEVSKLEGDKQATGATTAGGAARLLTPMAATIAPAVLTGGGSMAVASGLSGLQTAGAQFPTTYKALIEQDVPEEQALSASRNAAITSGLITTALTAAFGKTGAEAALLTGAGGKELVKSRLIATLKGIAKGSAAEIPEELLDEASSQVIEQRTIDPNKPVSQIVDEFAQTAPDLAMQIALLGGVGGGVGGFRGSTTTPGGAPTVPETAAQPAPDTDFSRRAAMEGATEYRAPAGTPVQVGGTTIARIPEGSPLTPEDVAEFAGEPDTMKAMARKGLITLPEIVAPVEGVDRNIIDAMNENIATSAALAPQTVEALKKSEEESRMFNEVLAAQAKISKDEETRLAQMQAQEEQAAAQEAEARRKGLEELKAGAARNAEVLREAAARLAGTEKGPDLGFAKVSPVTPETNPAEIHRKRNAETKSHLVIDENGDIDRKATKEKREALAKAAGMTRDEWEDTQAALNVKAKEDFFKALNKGDTVEWVDSNGNARTGRVEIELDGTKVVRDTTEGSVAQYYKYTNQAGEFGMNADSLKVTPKGQQVSPVTEGTVMPGGSAIERDATRLSRGKPRESIAFKKPVITPLGEVVGYSWSSQLVEDVDKAGEPILRRVSNWEEAANNAETGRDIVHRFLIRKPDGSASEVSLESTFGKMTAADKQTIKSVISAAKRLPFMRAELAELQDLQKRSDEDYQRTQKLVPDPAKFELREPDVEWRKKTGDKVAYLDGVFLEYVRGSDLNTKGELPSKAKFIYDNAWKWQGAQRKVEITPAQSDRLKSITRSVKKAEELLKKENVEVAKVTADEQPSSLAETGPPVSDTKTTSVTTDQPAPISYEPTNTKRGRQGSVDVGIPSGSAETVSPSGSTIERPSLGVTGKQILGAWRSIQGVQVAPGETVVGRDVNGGGTYAFINDRLVKLRRNDRGFETTYTEATDGDWQDVSDALDRGALQVEVRKITGLGGYQKADAGKTVRVLHQATGRPLQEFLDTPEGSAYEVRMQKAIADRGPKQSPQTTTVAAPKPTPQPTQADETPSTQSGESLRTEPATAGQGTNIGNGQVQAPRDAAAAPAPVQRDQPQVISLNPSDLQVIPEDLARAKENQKAGNDRWQQAAASTEPISVIQLPNGQYRILDGHHRALNAIAKGEQIQAIVEKPWKPAVNEPATFTATNGQKIVGTVSHIASNGKATVNFVWNGKDQSLAVPVSQLSRPITSLADGPKYVMTQEQNTRKAGKHFPTAPGVHENFDFNKAFASMAEDTSLSRMYREIAKLLAKMPAFANVDLHVVADGRKRYAGEYSHHKGKSAIAVNLRQVARGNVDALGTILHEALHHLTMAKIRDPQGDVELDAVAAIHQLRKKAEKYAKDNGKFDKFWYEFSNNDEFLTGVFTRQDFQEFLASIPSGDIGKFRSLLSEVFRRIAELITGKRVPAGSTLEQSIASILTLFETPYRGIETGALEKLSAVRSKPDESASDAEYMAAMEDIKNIVNASISRVEVDTLLKGLNTEGVKEITRSLGYPTQGTKSDNIKRILSFVGSRADAIAIRGEAPANLNAPTIVRSLEQQAAFDEERRAAKERAKELDVYAPKKKPRTAEEFARDMAALMAPSQGFVTPEQDAEYMAAVESGDVAKQQAMVDAAAKAAGYTVEGFHGTDEKFTEFKSDAETRRDSGEKGKGFYFSPKEGFASLHGKHTGRFWVRLKNPFAFNQGSKQIQTVLDIAGPRPSGGLIKGVAEANPWSQKVRDGLVSLGYDGATDTSEVTPGGIKRFANEFVVFDPNQIKSADPITRDAEGNVIPLSQRFNEKSNDTRFSLAEGSDTIAAAALRDPRTGKIFTGATHGDANPRDRSQLDLGKAKEPSDHIGYVAGDGRWVSQDEAEKHWGIRGSESSAAYWADPEVHKEVLGEGDYGWAEPLSEQQYQAELQKRRVAEAEAFKKSGGTAASLAENTPTVQTAVMFDGKPLVAANGVTHYDLLKNWIKKNLLQPYQRENADEANALADKLFTNEFMREHGVREGFMVNGEFVNRQEALQAIRNAGQTVPGATAENRDWLDSSDLASTPKSMVEDADQLKSKVGQALEAEDTQALKALVPSDVTVVRAVDHKDLDEDGQPSEYFFLTNGSPDQVRPTLRNDKPRDSWSLDENSEDYSDRDARGWLHEVLFDSFLPSSNFKNVEVHRLSTQMSGGEFNSESNSILYAAPINPSQSDKQSADDRGGSGTPDAEAGGRADSAKFSPMADARREAAISAAVAENDWGNYTREQKVAAAESFLTKWVSPVRALEFPPDVRFSVAVGDGSGANVTIHEIPSQPLGVTINVGQSQVIDKYSGLAPQEVFAHLYDSAQEEIIHVAHYLGMHREWLAARAKGSAAKFVPYLKRLLKDTFNQVNNARIALQQTDSAAAKKIKEAMLASWNVYHRDAPVTGIAGLWDRLEGDVEAQADFTSEMIRQLTQLKRQDFTTETGWQKFQRVLKQWLTDAINSLRGVQDIFRSGMAGDLIQKQLSDLEAALDGKPLPPAPEVGGTPKSIPEGEPPRTYDVGGEAEPADGKGKQLYQKKPTAIGSTYTTPADVTLQEKKTQEETLAAARTIIGESVKVDGPIKGRRAALDRFRLDTSIPPEVRAAGTGLIAQQTDILASLEEGDQQLLLDEMTDEAAKLSGVIASDPDSFKNLKADANLNIDKMAEEAGRTLNIFNVFRRLTPEGFLRRMTRKYNDAVREKVEQNFDVPASEVEQEIMRLWKMMQEAGATARGESIAAALKAFMPRRVNTRKIIESLFPQAGFRDRMNKGGEALVRNFFQMMAGPRDGKGPLAEFDETIQGALSSMLRKVMEAQGLVAKNESNQMTDIDKMVRAVSGDELRFDKIAAADEAMQKELADIKDPERRAVLQQAWEEATSKMFTNIASDATVRRAINTELKSANVDWTKMFDSNQKPAAIRTKVVDAVMGKIEALLTDPTSSTVQNNLGMLRDEVGAAFDFIADNKRTQWLAQREAVEARRRVAEHRAAFKEALRNQGVAEQAINRISEKLAGPQRGKPDQNPVSALVGEHMKKEVADFVDKLVALDVDRATAESLDKAASTLRTEIAAAEKLKAADRAVKELMKSLKPKPRAPREKIEKSLKALFTADTVGALDDQAFFDAFGEAFGMPPLSGEQQARIKKLVREINSMPKGPARLDKQQDLDEELALWKGIAARDVLLSAWYANILSGVSTQGMGMLGNLLNFVPRSLFNAIANPRSAGAYLKGALGEGLSTGIEEAKAALKGRGLYKVSKYGDKNLVSALELLRKKGPSTLPEWVAYIASGGTRLRYVFRIMQAIDALAWNTAREGHAYLAAHRALLQQEKETGQKRSPEEFYKAFIDSLGGDTAQIEEDLRDARQKLIDAGQTPSLLTVDRMARETRNARRTAAGTKGATRFADRIVLQQDPEGSGKFISSLIEVFQKKGNILGLPVGQMLIPFNKIVSNLFEQSLDYTPVGALRAYLGGHLSDVKLGGLLKGKVEFEDKAQLFDQMERRERAMAATAGMAAAAIMYAMAHAYKDEPDEDVPFMVYGWGPESKNKRAQMPKGWVPYSVKMGDQYVKFSEMPFGMMFAAAGSAMDAMRYKNMDKKTSTQRLAYILKTAVKGFMNQGVMSSLDTAMETMMFDASEKKMTDIPINAVKGLIPAQGMLRDISTIMDPNKVSSDSLTSALLRDIPFAKSYGTKPELNVFGEPIKMDGYPIIRRITTHREPHAVADYLGRNDLSIPGMEPTVEIGKYLPDQMKDRIQRRAVELGAMENGLFTPEQNYEFKKRAGQLTKVAVENIMSQAPKITNDVQRKHVQSLIDKRVEVARRRAMLEAVPVQ